MKEVKDKKERLRLILTEAHRRKQAQGPKPSPAWRQGVMKQLTGLSGRAVRIDPWAAMEKMVWKFVPAAGALALILAILVSQVGADPASETVRILTADSSQSGLYSFYQSEPRNE